MILHGQNLKVTAFFSTLLLSCPAAIADDDSMFLFMDNSLTLLAGTGYEVPGSNITTLTIEHASGWTWGDIFAFVDILDYHSNPFADSGWYGELSPRVSLSKLGLLDMGENSFVSDVLIAGTWERGKGTTEALLLGLGFDLKLPGFLFFQANFYARKETGHGVGFKDMQWTLAWNRPFAVGEEKFVINGFMDYVVGWGPQAANVHFVPQIKWDIGAKWGKPGKVYFGTEIDYWHNQFGIQDSAAFDTDQLAINAILQVHF